MIYPATYNITILQNATWRGSFRPWEEYCEASLDLSNQDDVGDNELAAMETLYCFFEKYDKALTRLADS